MAPCRVMRVLTGALSNCHLCHAPCLSRFPPVLPTKAPCAKLVASPFVSASSDLCCSSKQEFAPFLPPRITPVYALPHPLPFPSVPPLFFLFSSSYPFMPPGPPSSSCPFTPLPRVPAFFALSFPLPPPPPHPPAPLDAICTLH